MKKPLLIALIAILISGTIACAGGKPPAGFTPLFNGKDLAGWKHDAEVEKHWKVFDGILAYDGKQDSLRTEKNYRNFILMVDWKIGKGGDSGIYLRGKPQVQIWDNPIGSGGLYNDSNNPVRNVDRPLGEWNNFVIIMRNGYVTVIENGIQVVDHVKMNSIDGLPSEGTIELQHHFSPLWFRNIYIRELPPTAETEARARQEDDIREAVFRYQLREFNSIINFLSVGNNDDDPSEELMNRLRAHEPLVKKVSQCTADMNEGVKDKETGAQGIILRAGSIKWINKTTVEVKGGYYADGLAASGNTYRVVLKDGKWVVEEDRMDWIS